LPIETYSVAKKESSQAEKVYRQIVGPDGRVKDNFRSFMKQMMIDEYDIVDKQLKDFEEPGVTNSIARLRYNHYQKKRITKLMKIGEMLKRVGDPGGRFTGETKLTRSLKKAVEQPQRGLGTRKSSSLSQLSDTFMKKMQNKQDERTGSAGIFLTMPPETSMGMSPRVNG